MKDNTLYDLNDILFDQLRSVTDKSLTGTKLDETIRVSTAVQGLSQNIIANAALVLRAGLTVNNSSAEVQMPKMIESPPQKVIEASSEKTMGATSTRPRKQEAVTPSKNLNG